MGHKLSKLSCVKTEEKKYGELNEKKFHREYSERIRIDPGNVQVDKEVANGNFGIVYKVR